MSNAGGGMNFFLKKVFIEAMLEGEKTFTFDNEGEYQNVAEVIKKQQEKRTDE